MTQVIHVVDFGIGNLLSVARAIEKVGGEARVTDDHANLAAADRLILPGVGAFRDGMAGISAKGLDTLVRSFASSGRPLLGICLGMQMLADESSEFGEHRGLGLVPGRIVPIPDDDTDGQRLKIPFVGWAELEATRPNGFADTPLAPVAPNSAVYLVHSYHFKTADSADVVATYSHGGRAVTAAIARKNIFGCQFHPEKSGTVGLDIVAEFLRY